MSSFRALDLFGSGPHRFVVPERALVVIPLWVIGSYGYDDGSGSVVLGEKELIVEVRGRLVASDEAGLWALRGAVAGEADTPQTKGALVDNDGRTWSDMTLVKYEETGAVDRGRVWSMGYVATFRRVTNEA